MKLLSDIVFIIGAMTIITMFDIIDCLGFRKYVPEWICICFVGMCKELIKVLKKY